MKTRQVAVIYRGNHYGVKYREKKFWLFWGPWLDVVDDGNDKTWGWSNKEAYQRADLIMENGAVSVKTGYYESKKVTAIWNRDEE